MFFSHQIAVSNPIFRMIYHHKVLPTHRRAPSTIQTCDSSHVMRACAHRIRAVHMMFHGDKSKCPNRKSLYHVYPSSISFIFASKDTVHTCTLYMFFLYSEHAFFVQKTPTSLDGFSPPPRHLSLPRSSTFSCHQGQPWRRWNASDRSGCSQCRCRRGRVHRSKLGSQVTMGIGLPWSTCS